MSEMIERVACWAAYWLYIVLPVSTAHRGLIRARLGCAESLLGPLAGAHVYRWDDRR
jgi:hypothetical protein